METTQRNQAHLVPDPMVGHQADPIDINQEDDFDFEIGGDDVYELTGEANNEVGDHVEMTQGHVDQAGRYRSQEQEPQATGANDHVDEGQEYGLQEVSTSLSGSDSLSAAAELTQDMENDLESNAQDDNQNDFEVADQEETDKNVEIFSEEEIYYEEKAVGFEDSENTAQPELVQDHDLRNTATSVGFVHEGDDSQGATLEEDDAKTETANNAVQYSKLVSETVQIVQVAKDFECEDQAQNTVAAAEAESGEAHNDPAGAILVHTDDNGEAATESLEHSNWGEEDDDHNGSNASPIVTVSYRGQEYSMFAQATEDDPDTYFLDGFESIHRPLSQFLENVREVISSEVEAGHELFVKIDGLGLEFGESTSKDFLDQTTLAQIIEVNDKLSQNDGGSQHAELYIFLSVRSNPLQRFAELAKGADEGHGLSYFEQYYEDSPADVSLFDDEEQQEVSQNIDSDDLVLEEPSGESEAAVDEASVDLNAAHDQNPFQVDGHQLSLNDAAISEILGGQTESVDIEADDNTPEAPNLEGILDSNSNDVQEGDDNSFGVAATDVEALEDDDNFGDAISVVEHVETRAGEGWDEDEEAEAQDGLGVVATEETTDEQTELLIGNSEEGHERSNGENPFFYNRDCKAISSCCCTGCSSSGHWEVERKDDRLSSAPPLSTPAMGTHSFLLSDADWDKLMVNSKQEEHTAADRQAPDFTASIPNDEDYLDLGHDAENQAVTTDTNAAEHFDIQQRTTPNSSATATLNGEENGQAGEAAATRDPEDLAEQTPNPTNENEDDEIDWNHEDDDDIGVADQNPTDLSPSSLSGKRSRLADEDIDGLGEDNGTSSAHGAPQVKANNLPVAKRRRT